MAKELLRMEDITKIYSNGFIANENVNLSVNEGEIHALIGENGAGKTTLMKILFGLEDHQTGHIYINGEEVNITSPLDAIAKGVGMVHQHFMQVPNLTVAENIVLGIEPGKAGILDIKKAKEVIRSTVEKIDGRYDDEIKVFVNELGASSVDIGVRFWAPMNNYWPIRWQTLEDVKYALEAAGMTIPFQQIDIHNK